jgi:lysophospholipase L1-like esterase
MAIKIYEQFAPFANPADGDYPSGSIKNDSIPGAEDGTPLDAVWANDYAGADAELFAQAGITPSGQPDKLGVSQRFEALEKFPKPATSITRESVSRNAGASLDALDATSYMSIYLYGGSPFKTAAENLTALRAAKAATGSVYFPNVQNGGSTYLIDGLTASDMLGLRWYADGLVLISVDSNQYDVNTGSVFMTDVHFYYRDKLFQFTAKANNQAIDGGLRLGVQKARSRIDGVTEFIPDNQLRGLSFDTQTDAVFSPISITDNGYYKSLAAVTGKTAGLFTNIAIGETISAVVNNNVFSNNNVGVCVKSNTGYYTILKDPTVTGSSINLYINVGGTTATGSQGYQHQGLLTSYEIQNATIAVTRLNKTDWKVTLNGDDIGPTFTGIGDITEVGFIAQSLPATADVNIDVFGISKQRSKHFTGVAQMEQIIIYGDSTADDFNGTFVQYLKQSLEGANGAKVVTVVNRAVAGTTLEEAYTRLVSDIGNYVGRFIVVMAGTNNIQGGVSLAASLATLNQFFDYADANSKKLIVVEPSMWYPKEIVSNKGQTTAAYEFGAKLRSCMQYETARRGYTFVRNTQLKCRPDYNLVGTNNDPSVRDNIHQSAAWMQEDAQNIAEHILHADSKITFGWMQLPKLWLASGWASGDAEYCIIEGKVIVRGSFSASAPLSNGANILNIPMVVKGGNFPSVSTDLSTTSACYVNVNDSGVVTLQQIQSALHSIIVLSVSV